MSMLHLELYDHGYTDTWDEWKLDETKPEHLKDPTPKLCDLPGSKVIYLDQYKESVEHFKTLNCLPTQRDYD